MITLLIVIAVILMLPLLLTLAITYVMKKQGWLICTSNKAVFWSARLLKAKVNYKGKTYYERK